MIRRRSSRREGRGVLGTVGRTALIAGTATAVSHGVANAMTSKAQQQSAQPAQEVTAAPVATPQQTDPIPASEPASQQVAGTSTDMIAQLQQLADLKAAGMLSNEEFEQAKSRVLAG